MMSPKNSKLLHFLDAYGADQSRWPDDAVRQFTALSASTNAGSTPEAEALQIRAGLREAVALDQVLSCASAVSAERQSALAARIMASVEEEVERKLNASAGQKVPASHGTSGNVIALPVRGADRVHARPHPAPALAAQFRYGIDVRAAAALAAALVLGIGVGVSGGASTTFQAVAETVGVSLDRSVVAYNDEHGGALAALDDEDVL
jgi:hypothetical protein